MRLISEIVACLILANSKISFATTLITHRPDTAARCQRIVRHWGQALHASQWLLTVAPLVGRPLVVAKGQDLLALRIREIAERHGVPVIENKSLARALHDQAEVGQLIPEEFYPAVAEIIHYLMTQEEKRRARAHARST